MLTLRSLPLVMTVALLAACGNGAPTRVNPAPSDTLAFLAPDTLPLALGTTATSRDRRLGITFMRLVQDSRCRGGVQSVWAGHAAVQLRGEVNDGVEATIHTTLDPRSFTVAHYKLTLLDVLPLPGVADSTRTPSVVVIDPSRAEPRSRGR